MHFRSVAGVFVLSTGLLIGIGSSAIATADTENVAGTQGPDSVNQSTGTSTSTTGTTDTQPAPSQDAVQGGGGAVGSTAVNNPSPATVTTGPTATNGPTESDLEKKWTETLTPTSNGTGTESGATATNTSTAPAPPVVASDSNVPASNSNVPAAETTVATSNSNVVSPVTTYASPLMDAMQPLTNAINAFANTASTIPAQAAALPASATPVADVITSVQQMLSTVAGVVAPLVQLPGDLYALLGVPEAAAPALIGHGGTAPFAVDEAAPLFGPQTSQGPTVVAPVSWEGSLFGTAVAPPDFDVIATSAAALAQQMSLSGMAQLAPEGIRPAGARSLLEHVVSAVLVPASLTALAALALPGIAGLLVVAAAGIRVGYRQAKAGLALRVSGIARFAGSGPMGVVRSGALISLHTRTPRVKRLSGPVEATTPVAIRHLERVA
jgi:hypothetical protein